jgi:hypothetical protein
MRATIEISSNVMDDGDAVLDATLLVDMTCMAWLVCVYWIVLQLETH